MDKFSNALTAIKEAGTTGASKAQDFFSSSAESGITAFKGTSLGESFFKNIGAILVVVMILLGGIIYIDLASGDGAAAASGAAASGAAGATTTPGVVERKVHIEPNTGIGKDIPTDVPWTVPAISMRNELKEAFGSKYTETELEKIHTGCSDAFCVMHQKSPEELERACNTMKTRTMCGTKCCCGWTKYTGFEGDNDPAVLMNTAEAKARAGGRSDSVKVPGKCVAGNSKRPYDMKDEKNQERDIAYYYYLGECVGGRGCLKEGTVKA
jgi:hypothetical protein